MRKISRDIRIRRVTAGGAPHGRAVPSEVEGRAPMGLPAGRTRRTDDDVLFEIGTEELPATVLADIFEPAAVSEKKENILESRLRELLNEKRISFRDCEVFATPRRLVFWVRGVAAAQTAKENILKGPSRQDAFNADGSPTEKLQGFLKARKVLLDRIEIASNQGKEFVFVKQLEAAKKTAEVLPEIFERLIPSVPFPKTMRWDDSGIVFARPIRHLLCLYGNRTIACRIGRLDAGNQTVIFRKGERKSYRVKDVEGYFKLLKEQGVILDPAARKEAIRKVLGKLARASKGRLYEDAFLLNEVNFLVEAPEGLGASFDREFLKLPLEVLTVSMARQQRIFGVMDGEGRVLPRFLAVLDGRAAEKEKRGISKNYERILRAKLQDSLFFYREDLKIPLEKKREELKGLVFLKNAGSMLEKSERLVGLAKRMGPAMGLDRKNQEILERACYLSKADLLTQMVGEFPELQGVMGKYYALESGENRETALAIGEQYLPRTAEDRLPETPAGCLLAIFDKCDLVAACFTLGLEPTSSLDPYGLRRSAAAVMKIMVDRQINLSLRKLLGETKAFRKLEDLFKDRFKALLVDRGFREDLVEAVIESDFEFPYGAYRRVEVLSRMVGEEDFSKAWKVVERTVNILKGNKEALPSPPEPSLFSEPLERRVFDHYEASHGGIRAAAASGDFQRATSLYAAAFFDILGEFFEKVFVNADDLAVRRNRLALLKAVRDLYTEKIADLSKMRLQSYVIARSEATKQSTLSSPRRRGSTA